MHYIGFSKNSINFMRSYLHRQVQAVMYEGKLAQYIQVESWVLQGPSLDHLLFILFTHEFHKSLRHCSSHIYSDDTQVFLSFDEYACSLINNDLNSLISVSK
ncbi:hypothetical protein JTB14_028828 [Gonioctena quinquepunctata]|nr:hypothetical protein JTB14_028828 [Gonioctena quinquepunctata]